MYLQQQQQQYVSEITLQTLVENLVSLTPASSKHRVSGFQSTAEKFPNVQKPLTTKVFVLHITAL
jgi:hypothetical protein